MQEVEIKYNRFKKPEVFNLSMPAGWDELSQSNILYIGNLWQSWQLMIANGLSLRKAKGLLFLELTGIKGKSKMVKLCEALAVQDETTGVDVLVLTDFIFKDFTLTKNLVPVITVTAFEKFYGPSDKLADISIDEFSFAFACYTQFHKTGKEEFLDKLAGVLYRPQSPDFKKSGERKMQFNNKLIDRYALVFGKLPDGYKNAVYLYFRGCLEFLVKRYGKVFNSENKSKSGGNFNQTVVMMSGAEFGPYDQTKRENLYVILDRLQQLIIENEKNSNK